MYFNKLLKWVNKGIKREPLVAITIIVTLLVVFINQYIPSYSDRKKEQEREKNEYVLSCKNPDLERVSVVKHEKFKDLMDDYYSLQYPLTCMFTNRTDKSISIESISPRVISNNFHSYSMLEFHSPFGYLFIANSLSKLTGEAPKLPRLLKPNEQFIFKSVLALPVSELYDNLKKACLSPPEVKLNPRKISICVDGEVYPVGNYVNIKWGGLMDLIGYGQGVKLGTGEEVIYKNDFEFPNTRCDMEGSKELLRCRNSGAYKKRKSYWTIPNYEPVIVIDSFKFVPDPNNPGTYKGIRQ